MKQLSSPEVEMRVIGILVKYPDAIDEITGKIYPAFFTVPEAKAAFEALQELHQEQKVSLTWLFAKLRGKVKDSERFLNACIESFISKAELEPCIEQLTELYNRRKLMQAALDIEKLALDGNQGYLSQAQQIIFSATKEGDNDEIKSWFDLLSEAMTQAILRGQGEADKGLSTGFAIMDKYLHGFRKGDLIILAARPSMGKTSLALNFAVNAARRDVPVLIFSLEMAAVDIADRVVSAWASIPGDIIAEGISGEAEDKYSQAAMELQKLPIEIRDKRGVTPSEIAAQARQYKAVKPELGLIVVDYLQLIRPDNDNGRKSHALLVGEIVRQLRELAGELEIPIILLSQLNRGVESRENKRPMMSDLRDSGNIEEFADVVMFIYREDYYNPEKARELGIVGMAEVIIAKQRKGRTGSLLLRFRPEYTRFEEPVPDWREKEYGD